MSAEVNRSKVAAGWLRRGFSCGLWVDSPGQRADFGDSIAEIVLVVEGRMEFEIDGRVYRPAIGEELLIPARTIHAARNIGSGTARWLYGYREG